MSRNTVRRFLRGEGLPRYSTVQKLDFVRIGRVRNPSLLEFQFGRKVCSTQAVLQFSSDSSDSWFSRWQRNPSGRGSPFSERRSFVHNVSEYLAAFGSAELRVRECIEPVSLEDTFARGPLYQFSPESYRKRGAGLPIALIWLLRRE